MNMSEYLFDWPLSSTYEGRFGIITVDSIDFVDSPPHTRGGLDKPSSMLRHQTASPQYATGGLASRTQEVARWRQ